MANAHMDLVLPDAVATERLGTSLAYACCGPGKGGVLYFEGELGAGKTTCVRSLLRTLGVRGVIRSPTYTLVESYALAGFDCVHADLYRLGAPSEVEALGLLDTVVDCLLLVEWPERGAGALPPADLDIRLSYRAAFRVARIGALSERGVSWLNLLQHDSRLTPYVPNLT